MENPIDFTGRTVAVTGGTRGIGRGIAQAFLKAGADVVVCGRSAPDELPSAEGRTAHFVATDVRDPDRSAEVITETIERFGRVDVLVNNAGGSPEADSATMSPRFVERIVALNLLAPFYVSQAANAVMQQQSDGGSIINIGSVAAHQAEPYTTAYAAAKAGLLQFTKALALEWAPKVRLNHITTGLIRTESAEAFYGDGTAISSIIPMQRMAVPDDVAAACLLLSSPLATYISGADLAVHGGGEFPARYVAVKALRAEQ